MLKRLGLTLCALVFAASAAGAQRRATAAREGVVVFRGKLGEKLTVQMRLRREGETLTGSYFYEDVGKDLSLRGTIDGAGSFELQEFDAAGARTGLFKGNWSGPKCEDCVDSLSGRWTRPDGTRPLAFTLGEFPVAFASDVRLVSKPVRESQKGRGKWGGYEISGEYPQLLGTGASIPKFNEEVRAFVFKDVADYRKMFTEDAGQGGELDLSFYVEWADDSLVSIDFSRYFFYNGAGERNALSAAFNYDLARGRRLRLADLFKPSSGYLKAISDACNRELRRQFEGESFPDSARIAESVEAVAGDDAKWLAGREGLAFVFDSTEFGPPGSGEHRVVVPYSELKPYVRTDGPLARLAK
jgi:Protein of unknown function (DUF3298)